MLLPLRSGPALLIFRRQRKQRFACAIINQIFFRREIKCATGIQRGGRCALLRLSITLALLSGKLTGKLGLMTRFLFIFLSAFCYRRAVCCAIRRSVTRLLLSGKSVAQMAFILARLFRPCWRRSLKTLLLFFRFFFRYTLRRQLNTIGSQLATRRQLNRIRPRQSGANTLLDLRISRSRLAGGAEAWHKRRGGGGRLRRAGQILCDLLRLSRLRRREIER